MPNVVDERIVEAKFDSSDFEKGVDKTIKKLDELKQSLHVKDASKSITELADETKKASEKTAESLDKLTDRFTNFAGMVKQKILGGLADQVAGVFFKIEHGITSLIHSLSSEQVSAGLSKYEQILTSVRIMMSAGQTESASYKAIERLNEYSDQTSYSLSQMTDAMSKMVAAGVDLDVAAKSVEGIANACAVAGVNATDASRAFYNLAQAYSKGTLNYTDYKSLELLNMTTREFKEQLLEAAATYGTLEKKVKKVKNEQGDLVEVAEYKTTNKKDKKVKGGKKVTVDNLSEMLKYDFVNKDVMNALFGGLYYFEELDPHEIKNKIAKMGLDEFKKQYGEVAYKAYMAAREARSLTDVMNALKDAISTGWAKSFEFLFGRLEEAKVFFTWLTENKFADAIYAIGELRNNLLEGWGENGGRSSIFEALKVFDSTLESALVNLGIFQKEVEGSVLSDTLKTYFTNLGIHLAILSVDIKDAAENFKKWFEGTDINGVSRIERIRQVIRGLGEAFNLFSFAVRTASDIVSPIIVALGDLIEKVLGPAFDFIDPQKTEDAVNPYKDFRNIIENIGIVLKPISGLLAEIIKAASDVAVFFEQGVFDNFALTVQFASDALGFFLEVLGLTSAQQKNGTGVLDGLVASIKEIGTACSNAIGFVSEFFSTLLKDIRRLIGIDVEGEEATDKGPFSAVINFFDTNKFLEDAEKWAKQAYEDVKSWIADLPNKIGNFGNMIYEAIFGLFYTKGKSKNAKFRHDDGTVVEGKDILVPTEFKKRLDLFFNNIKAAILKWKKKIESIKLQDIINGIFTKSTTDDKGKTKTEKTAFAQLLEKIFGEEPVKKAKDKIDGFIGQIQLFIDNTKTTIDSIWNSITTGFDTGDIFESLKSIFHSIIMYIASLFSGTTDVELNGEFFANAIANVITKIKIKAEEAWPRVKAFIISIPNKIYSIFSGTDESGEVKDKSAIQEAITSFGESVGKFLLEDLPETIKIFIDEAVEVIDSLWTNIYKALSGESSERKSKGRSAINSSLLAEHEKEEETAWTIFADNLKEIIVGIFEKLPVWIAEGIDAAIKAIGWCIDKISTYLNEINLAEMLSDDNLDIAKDVAEKTAESAEEGNTEESNRLLTAITKIGQSIAKLITETIPAFISAAFTTVGGKAAGWWSSLTGIFNEWLNDGEEERTFEENIALIGERIKTFLLSIPEYIKEGIENVKKVITGEISVEDLLTGTITPGKKNGSNASINSSLAAEQEEETNFFKKAIIEIANKLQELLTETIPEKIKSGFTDIKNNVGGWWESVKTIFDGWLNDKGEEKGLRTKISEIGIKIKNFILDIPKYIQEGLDFVSKYFRGKNTEEEITESLFSDKKELEKLTPEKILKDMTKQGAKPNIPTPAKDPGFSGFFDNLMDSLRELADNLDIAGIFKSIGETVKKSFGIILPFIIEGWNGLWEKIDKLVSYVGEIIGGKPIEDVLKDIFGEEQGTKIHESLVKFGDIIEKFVTQTIPAALGSALGAIVDNAPVLFDKFFGGLTTAFNNVAGKKETTISQQSGKGSPLQTILEENGITADSSKEIKGAEKAVEDTTQVINNILGNLQTGILSGAALTVTGILGVVLIIKALGELFRSITITGRQAQKAEAKNSLEAVFKRMFEALMVLLAVVSYMGTLDDTHYKHASDTLDKVIQFVEIMGGLIAAVKTGTSLLDFLGGNDAQQTTSAGDKVQNGLAGLLNTIIGAGKTVITAGVGWFVGGTTANTISDIFNELVSMLERISSGVETISENLGNAVKKLQGIEKKVPVAKRGVEATIEMFDLFRALSEEGRKEAFEYANKAMIDLSGTITLINNAFSGDNIHADEIVKALNDLIDLQSKMTEFGDYASTDNFKNFKYGIMALGTALSTFKGESFNSFKEIDPNDSTPINNAVDVLKQILANDNIKKLSESLNTDNVPNQDDTLIVAERLSILAAALITLGSAASGLNDDTAGNITKLFETINSIGKDKEGKEISGFGWGYTQEADDVTSLSGKMGTLGNALGSFADNTKDLTDINVDNVKRVLDIFVALSDSLNRAAKGPIEKFITGGEDLNQFAANIETLGQKLRNFFKSVDFDDSGKAITHNEKNIKMIGDFMLRLGTMLSSISYTAPNDKISQLNQSLPSFADTLITFIYKIQDASKGTEELKSFDPNNIGVVDAVVGVFRKLATLAHDIGTQQTKLDKTYLKEFIDLLSGNVGKTLINEIVKFGNLTTTLTDAQKIDVKQVTAYFNSIGTLISSIGFIIGEYADKMKDNEENDARNLMKLIVQAMHTLANDTNISYINDFLGKCKKLDYAGIDAAHQLASVIHEIYGICYDMKQWQTELGNTGTLADVTSTIENAINGIATLDFGKLDVLAETAEQHMHNIDVAKAVFETMKELAMTMYYFGGLGLTRSEGNAFDAVMDNAVRSIGQIDWDVISEATSKLVDSITDERNHEKYMSAGKTVAFYIAKGIQEAFDNPDSDSGVSVKITPIVDIDGMNNQLLNSGLTANGGTISLSFANSDLPTYLAELKPIDYTSTLSSISSTIDNISAELGRTHQDIANLKVYMSTGQMVGVLAPYIDEYIGQQMFILSRTGIDI